MNSEPAFESQEGERPSPFPTSMVIPAMGWMKTAKLGAGSALCMYPIFTFGTEARSAAKKCGNLTMGYEGDNEKNAERYWSRDAHCKNQVNQAPLFHPQQDQNT